MSDIAFYDQWKLAAPEDESDPPWGTCRKCGHDGHLYSLSPVGHGELCNTCLTKAVQPEAK